MAFLVWIRRPKATCLSVLPLPSDLSPWSISLLISNVLIGLSRGCEPSLKIFKRSSFSVITMSSFGLCSIFSLPLFSNGLSNQKCLIMNWPFFYIFKGGIHSLPLVSGWSDLSLYIKTLMSERGSCKFDSMKATNCSPYSNSMTCSFWLRSANVLNMRHYFGTFDP